MVYALQTEAHGTPERMNAPTITAELVHITTAPRFRSIGGEQAVVCHGATGASIQEALAALFQTLGSANHLSDQDIWAEGLEGSGWVWDRDGECFATVQSQWHEGEERRWVVFID